MMIDYPCCIFTIVDKGRGKDCIKAARAAGARGGTIVRGHSRKRSRGLILSISNRASKDTVIVVTRKNKAASIKKDLF